MVQRHDRNAKRLRSKTVRKKTKKFVYRRLLFLPEGVKSPKKQTSYQRARLLRIENALREDRILRRWLGLDDDTTTHTEPHTSGYAPSYEIGLLFPYIYKRKYHEQIKHFDREVLRPTASG